jgi:hypothetical protein
MGMIAEANQQRTKELLLLLLKDPQELTGEETSELIEEKVTLLQILILMQKRLQSDVLIIQTRRARKQELSQLSTEALVAMQESFEKRRTTILTGRGTNAIGDSFFEPVLFGPDEDIVRELLAERGAGKRP